MAKGRQKPKIGLVLSGGGARGAYEVGVLAWIAEHCPELLDATRVITGASVGAVNAAFLASRGLTPAGIRELVDIWESLHMEQVMRFSVGHATRMVGATLGRLVTRIGSPPTGFFRGGLLRALVVDIVDWQGLHQQIAAGRFDAVAVAATEIGSGQTHLFVEQAPALTEPRWSYDQGIQAIAREITPECVLASTSLPFIFPPVEIGGYWYTDGGIRQNTPLSPALRLGADRLLVLSIGGGHQASNPSGTFPGLGQLLGKLFNSIFLDRLIWDLNRLDRLNEVLEAGKRAFGASFVSKLQKELKQMGTRPYQPVRYVNIAPTVDIGVLAARLLRDPDALNSHLERPLRALWTSDNLSNADAASYLLFDGAFARELIALGRGDAELHADALRGLLN